VLTYDDLQHAPDDGLRRELIGGELYMTPAPSPQHQRIVRDVFRALDEYASRSGGEALFAPLDVVFTQIDVVEPDVLYFTAERREAIGETAVRAAPSLVVEILSPSTSEIDAEGGKKYTLYARQRVPEYWVVNPKTLRVDAYAEPDRAAGMYRNHFVGDGSIESATLPGLCATVS